MMNGDENVSFFETFRGKVTSQFCNENSIVQIGSRLYLLVPFVVITMEFEFMLAFGYVSDEVQNL